MIVPVLKAVKHSEVEITPEILREIVQNYDPKYLKAPAKVGHEQEEQQAYGYVERVFLIDDVLYADVKPSPELVRMIQENKLLSVSAEIRKEEGKGWYLVGIAFLGKDLPAVKGLPYFELSEVYFSEKELKETKPRPVQHTTREFIEKLPVMDIEWDGDAAKKRIRDEKGWETLAKSVIYVLQSGKELPTNLSAYKYPFLDYIDGKLVIVKRAVSAIKAFRNGAYGNRPDEEEAELIDRVLPVLEEKIEEFDKEQEEKQMSEKMKEMEEKLKKLEEEKKQLEEKLREYHLREKLSVLNFSEDEMKEWMEILKGLDEKKADALIEKLKRTAGADRKNLLLSEKYSRSREENDVRTIWEKAGILKKEG